MSVSKDQTQRQIFGEKDIRKVMEMQMKLEDVLIENIEFDLRSRDEIAKVVNRAPTYILRSGKDEEGKVLMELIAEDVDPDNGRSGMDI